MKATMTIDYVDPNVRDPWTGGQRPMWFPECRFTDGSVGSGIAFSASGAKEWIDAFEKLRDQPTEFELEDNGTYQGTQKWKVKDFPGKPAGGGGGGGGSKGGGGMSHAQAGLLAAASALGPVFAERESVEGDQIPVAVFADDIVQLADILTDHLFTRRGGQASGQSGDSPVADAEEGEPAPAPAPPEEQMTLPQMRTLRQLAKARGLETNEEIATAAGVADFKDITKDDADNLIELWSA